MHWRWDIVGDHRAGAPTMSKPGAMDSDLSGQPFVTIGGGALPLPMPTHPATLTATRVATKATSTFFIGIPLSSRHAIHTSCLAAPLVARFPPIVHRLQHFEGQLCPWGHTYAACAAKLAENGREKVVRELPPSVFFTIAWNAAVFTAVPRTPGGTVQQAAFASGQVRLCR